MIKDNKNKPCVCIGVLEHADQEKKLREVQAGLEEEGVPAEVMYETGTDLLLLSYQAASRSQLGVGIGIGENEIITHYYKLPPAKPLFQTSTAGTPAEWRYSGGNAARLVKGIPFKVQTTSQNTESTEQDELKSLIQKVIRKIMSERLPALEVKA